jgi:hypothetical protein
MMLNKPSLESPFCILLFDGSRNITGVSRVISSHPSSQKATPPVPAAASSACLWSHRWGSTTCHSQHPQPEMIQTARSKVMEILMVDK